MAALRIGALRASAILQLLFGIVSAGLLGGRSVWASEPSTAGTPWSQPPLARPRLDSPSPLPPPATSLAKPDTASVVIATKELHVPARLRLLVFAPHPDDETIAAGGLLQRVLAAQGTVRVVFVTNGDGYAAAVREAVHRPAASTRDFIEYGQRRHDEAVEALRTIGVPADNALFLGFPDDGIDDLWAGHWSDRHPYTSPYTQLDRPLYRESMRRDIEYAGADLESEIARAMRDFQPDWVLTPDPRDRHPDHCTTGVFVLDALRQLRQSEARFAATKVLAYLVHAPDYPSSPAWVGETAAVGVGGSATARHVLAGTVWIRSPLNATQHANKQAAIAAYRSQVQVMRPFLQQFLRPFEVFSQLDAAQIVAVPQEHAARFGRRK